MADGVGALALIQINAVRGWTRREGLVAAAYLFNPYTIMSCLARSTTTLDNTLLLTTIALAAKGHHTALVTLALAAHTSLYPILLLPPVLMLMPGKRNALVFAAAFSAITLGNQALFNSEWLGQTWGIITGVSELTPNVGMWWYFFTEMFDHFRPFFLGVFQLHIAIYVAPICLRLQDDPLQAILLLVGIFSTWKSYPTLGDLAVWAGLLGCFPEIVSNLRHPLFTLTVYLYTLILLPLLHSLWLLTGTGNANFFYAATMVHGLNSSLAIVDVLGAILRDRVRKAVPHWANSYQVVQLNKNV